MEKSYAKRYTKPDMDRHRGRIAEQLGVAAVTLKRDMDPDDSELLLVDDASAFPLAMTDDPRYTATFLKTRADVVYVDEERGTVRFNGPVGGRRRGEASQPSGEPMPLPALLWRAGIEPGVWVVVSGYEGEKGDFMVTLVRVTEKILERGRSLSRELEWN